MHVISQINPLDKLWAMRFSLSKKKPFFDQLENTSYHGPARHNGSKLTFLPPRVRTDLCAYHYVSSSSRNLFKIHCEKSWRTHETLSLFTHNKGLFITILFKMPSGERKRMLKLSLLCFQDKENNMSCRERERANTDLEYSFCIFL